ncbi:MAG: hypothetical protein LBM66_08080 [Bifidobacteriaceae bacterium]|jgi:predicted metal-dependent HD superfamily phosphohydrolase|nr:hypothetical protein [Bifidobacteriaceae bacterium]
MSVTGAPDWLEAAYVRAAQEAKCTAPRERIEQAAAALVERWCSPGRICHGLKHLADVLTRVDELAPGTQAPPLVRLAAFYHGAVFDDDSEAADAEDGTADGAEADTADAEVTALGPVLGGCNREDAVAGAELARRDLTGLGLAPDRVERVVALITLLRGWRPLGPDPDSAVLRDATLGLLAHEPQRYTEYIRQLQEENPGLTRRAFLERRAALIEHLLALPSIYGSPGAAEWESSADQNLRAELARTRKAITALAVLDDDAALEAEQTGSPQREAPVAV